MKNIDSISAATYRRFILGLQGLWPGRRWAGKAGTSKAIHTVEAIQVDPVSVVAQSHDIALWERVSAYRADHLNKLMYIERKFFDYGGHLMIYPVEEFPYWRTRMEKRKTSPYWSDFLQANQATVERVRQEIRTRGPLRTRDVKGKKVNRYRSSRDSGMAMYYLWIIGELTIHSRQGRDRVYDFTDKLIPDHLLKSASESEANTYFIQKAISQHGLVSEREFHKILKTVTEQPVEIEKMKDYLAEMTTAGELDSVQIENRRENLYYLANRKPILNKLSTGRIPSSWQPHSTNTEEEVTFRSPLEYVSARGRAKKVFGFDYTWEIYKPTHTRKYGPYTLPVLYGDRLAARIDLKYERQTTMLLINGFWLEEWFKADSTFSLALAKGLHHFASFLGAELVNSSLLTPPALRKTVEQYLKKNDLKIL